MKRILIATDGSAHVLKAAQLAGELAASMGAELHVLAVAYRDRKGERWQGEFAKIEDIGIADVAVSLVRTHVEQVRRQAETKGVTAIETSVADGEPAEEILAYIATKKLTLSS
jgi:nucleotide-binding universal stress UspA family protein